MANGAPTVSNGLVISGVTTTSDIRVGTGASLMYMVVQIFLEL